MFRDGWVALLVACCAVGAARADDAGRAVACEPAPPPAAELREGDTLLAREEPAEALSAYERSQHRAERAGDLEAAAVARVAAVRAALELEETSVFLTRLDAARDALQSLGHPARHSALLIHLGRSAALAADVGATPRLRLRANELFEQGEIWAERAGDARLRSFALGYRADLYQRAGRSEDAERLARQALFAASAAGAPDSLYRWQWLLARLHAAKGDADAALASYRQAVDALGQVQASLSVAHSDPAYRFRSEAEPVYLGLVDLLLRQAARTDESTRQQALLREAVDALERLKTAELRDFFNDPCLAVQRVAAPDEIAGAMLVYPVLLADRVELITSTAGRLARVLSPVDGPSLEAAARRLRALLVKRATRQFEIPAGQLYDWIVRPLHPIIEAADPDTLVFVPAGALRSIPFAALLDRRRGRFLVERLPVAVVPGLSLTEPRPIERQGVQLLAAGISEGIQGFPALMNVPRELAAVAETFPSQKLLNEEFSAEGFVQALTRAPFGIVHIASHGEFGTDAADSFILTWDGRISMDRMAEAVSRTRYRDEHPMELLVLSACQTATGDERAALGLAGVAVRAGARSAVATLWSVSDSAAADLMTRFYAELSQPGASRAWALQQAQRSLLDQPAYRHPIHWAAFVLINSWL